MFKVKVSDEVMLTSSCTFMIYMTHAYTQAHTDIQLIRYKQLQKKNMLPPLPFKEVTPAC